MRKEKRLEKNRLFIALFETLADEIVFLGGKKKGFKGNDCGLCIEKVKQTNSVFFCKCASLLKSDLQNRSNE